MKRKRTGLLICGLLLALYAMPQDAPQFPALLESDLPGSKTVRTRTFEGDALYGYMNGGADLYLEYGISSALITEFSLDKSRYKVEIFRMPDPLSAFGIFSVSRFRCSSRPGFADLTCLNRYQLQFCKGNYYVSIINDTGTPADSVIAVRAGAIIAGRINEPAPDLRGFVPESDPILLRNMSVLVKGKLGLMNGAPDHEDYFKGAGGYTLLILPQKEKTLFSVRFGNAEDFKIFMDLHGWGTCDLSSSDLKMRTGETMRLMGEYHLLIGMAN